MRPIALSLVLLLAMAACATDTPASAPQSQPPSCPSPQPDGNFPADVYNWRLTFTPDRKTAYWASSKGFFPQSRKAEIVSARLESGRWTAPAPVSLLAPGVTVMDPYVTPDGATLLFSAIDGKSDLDLWAAARSAGGGWERPRHLGAAVNSDADELYASVDRAGNLYFASDREYGGWDLYRSAPDGKGGFQPAQRLADTVNGDGWDFNPDISPDGKTIVFVRLNHKDGFGLGDLWITREVGGAFTAPVNLGPCVNSRDDEYHPTVLWDDPANPVLYFVKGGRFVKTTLPRA